MKQNTNTAAPAPMTWDPIAAQNAERRAAMQERALMLATKQIEREAAAKANPKSKANRAAKTNEPRTIPCECGCGAIPRGAKSRFLPGHDAKALHAEIAAIKASLVS